METSRVSTALPIFGASARRAGVVLAAVALMTVVVSRDIAVAGTVTVRPGQSLARVAASHGAGTTFRLRAGTFNTRTVQLQSRDKVLGAGVRATSVRFNGNMGFDTSGATGVEIAYLNLSGARGTKLSCGKQCGRGIHRGINAYYHHLRSHHNAAMGIGGGLHGARLVNVELDHNGSRANFGCCSAGVKSGKPYSIVNSYVHDNVGNGIWCDQVCGASGAMNVIGNRVVNHALDGIHMEWSQGANAMIKNNYVRGSRRYGIHIAQFSFAWVIGNNVAGSTRSGIAFRSSRRGQARGVARGNRTDGLSGCSLPGVTCS